ncbi:MULTISPECIES: Spy/CpxP family protein refolding chaperone [unclassified Bradyrhizobium]|uniref:Spy/CpxP family protein refolding chaperone n=1 Tax=unclassified Bradyrhizobium TaxID=2631580 RepID=UPI0028E92D42|nr:MULTISPECIES: Spy/CpxP family protein refolding chaperone [unclassified Bradyrhizobium]
MRVQATTFFAATLVLAIVASPASAQPGPSATQGWGPGMMMGPGMMGGRGFGFFCHPRMAGFAEWRISAIEAAVKPNDTQRARLDELKAASAKAADIITKDCPTALPAKATDRLALAEQRLDAMQQAIKIVRPAFQAFYDSLDDKQKATLDASGPRHWGWHHWHWPWSED